MNWVAIIGTLSLLCCIVGFITYMMRKAALGGRAEAESEQKGAVLDAIVEHQATKNAVDALPADSARKRLQSWSRD